MSRKLLLKSLALERNFHGLFAVLRIEYNLLMTDVRLEIESGLLPMGRSFGLKRAGENRSNAYKRVNRPLDNAYNTYVFLRELRSLKLLRGECHIVQLRYLVVSMNPYQTKLADSDPLVIMGFLLDYHPHRYFEERLQKKRFGPTSPQTLATANWIWAVAPPSERHCPYGSQTFEGCHLYLWQRFTHQYRGNRRR